MAYLLDADVFIRAKNLHYGLDFCPAFRDWLIKNNLNGKVFSVEKVEDEVMAVKDELSDWADALGSGFFLRPDSSTFPSLAMVSNWVTEQDYEPSAVMWHPESEAHGSEFESKLIRKVFDLPGRD